MSDIHLSAEKASSPEIAWMSLALQLAERGLFTTDPNPRVGCVLVKAGRLIGQGWHEQAGLGHAEVNALRDAEKSGESVTGATAFVTLEPCSHHGKTPPCCDALINAKVSKVVMAMEDPNPLVAGNGIRKLKEAGIEVEVGLLEEQARALNPGFIKRMQGQLPWVRSKVAISLDGRTAMQSGESQWITGPDARLDVQKWRARSSCIVTGIGTVLHDDCSLTVRPDQWSTSYFHSQASVSHIRQPHRVVLDRQASMPAEAKILQADAVTWMVTESEKTVAPKIVQDLQNTGGGLLVLDKAEVGRPSEERPSSNLAQLLKQLSDQQMNEVLVEAGATLTGAFIEQQLVDELIIYMAPKLLGSDARPLARLPFMKMSQAINLNVTDIRQVGKDIRIIATLDNERE